MLFTKSQLNVLDTPVHRGQRRKMVEELAKLGITNEAVLKAMGKIPRHLFIESAFQQHAYQNRAFRIASGQTISHPFTVARQTELLQVQTSDSVLEIGTGSGYQAAVLLELGVQLTSIEVVSILSEKAQKLLKSLGYEANFLIQDGSKGYPQSAPYDKIILTCGASSIPQPLIEQLKEGGHLVIPIGDRETQIMHRITKGKKGKLSQERFEEFSFVPLTGEFGWK